MHERYNLAFFRLLMGNASSDSMDHSFKRLRLSQTEKLLLASPSYMSPKRKISSNNTAELTEPLNNESANNLNDQSPTLACQNDVSFSSVNPVLEPSKPIMNQLSNEDYSSDEELLCLIKSFTRSKIFHDKNICTNQKSSDEEIKVNLTSTNIIPELSDDDLVACIKYAYTNKEDEYED